MYISNNEDISHKECMYMYIRILYLICGHMNDQPVNALGPWGYGRGLSGRAVLGTARAPNSSA